MTVAVTLTGGGTDKYMRFGDAYVKHHNGTLDVIRTGAKPVSYPSGSWIDVVGDEKRFKTRGFSDLHRRELRPDTERTAEPVHAAFRRNRCGAKR
jgi:hypothetical protein